MASTLTLFLTGAVWRLTQSYRDKQNFESYKRESAVYKKYQREILWKDEIDAMEKAKVDTARALELASGSWQGTEALLEAVRTQGLALAEMPRISDAMTNMSTTLETISRNQEAFREKFESHAIEVGRMAGAFEEWRGQERRREERRAEERRHDERRIEERRNDERRIEERRHETDR